MRRLFLSVAILAVSLLAAFYILRLWRGLRLLESHPSRENLLLSMGSIPSSPDPFYRLGLFYEWDMRNIDLKESARFLEGAIRRNPFEQRYWLNLAQILHKMDEEDRSREALEKGIFVFPTGYTGRWVSATLLLEQGATEKALTHFRYILSNYPNKSQTVYSVLHRTLDDTDFMLEKVVPKDPYSLNQYISYLYETGDLPSVRKGWQRKISEGFKSSREETLRYIQFLISHGEVNEAFEVWEGRIREEGLPIPSDGDRITNGGFEKEEVLGGGFDWRIEKVEGAEISPDPSVAFEGRRSMKIVFSGKENVDFRHVYQFVSLKPDTEYFLQAQMRSQGITTRSGVKMEVVGVGAAFQRASESLTGDNEWKGVTLSFRTPAQSKGGVVRVRREKTDKLDRFIGGTVWIDRVRLTEKAQSPSLRKR
jgi:tetratricopeptide (TPR) repeat protein